MLKGRTRCRMINIEPDSGVEDKAYLRILSKYRRSGAATHFGILLAIRNGPNQMTFLKNGDEVCL